MSLAACVIKTRVKRALQQLRQISEHSIHASVNICANLRSCKFRAYSSNAISATSTAQRAVIGRLCACVQRRAFD